VVIAEPGRRRQAEGEDKSGDKDEKSQGARPAERANLRQGHLGPLRGTGPRKALALSLLGGAGQLPQSRLIGTQGRTDLPGCPGPSRCRDFARAGQLRLSLSSANQ